MSRTSPMVFVSIVHWNDGPSTLACIESVLAERQSNLFVVVVDNGSTDGIADTIESRWPEIQVVRNATNTGFTGGHNRGIELAMSRQADYVILLNQDALLVPGCIARMVALAESDPRVGLVSPTIHFSDEPSRPQFVGSWLDRDAITVVDDGDLDLVRARDADPAVTMCLWGTALMIRRAVVEAIGSLDDRLFAYFEDTDYCVRASMPAGEAGCASTRRSCTKDIRPDIRARRISSISPSGTRCRSGARHCRHARHCGCDAVASMRRSRPARSVCGTRSGDVTDRTTRPAALRWFHAAHRQHPYLLADALEGRLLRAFAARLTSTRSVR